MILLVAEPPIQAMLVEGMPTLSTCNRAGDVWIAEQDAVIADLLEGLLADAAVEKD